MSFAELLTRWNRWYESLPETWRFQLVVWSILVVGMINMMLTVSSGFPFGLLVLLAIAALAAIRLPYVRGWFAPPEIVPPVGTPRVEAPGWLLDINRRYEALPDTQRVWVYPAVLLVAGAINMMLTISHVFPFGVLFLLALLALVLIRAPYAAGWLAAPHAGPEAHEPPVVEHPPAAPEAPPPTTETVPVAIVPAVAETAVPPAVEAHTPPPPVAEPDPTPPADEVHALPLPVEAPAAKPPATVPHAAPPPVADPASHPAAD